VNVGDVQSHDVQKSELCKQAGITLIEIPYWWDLSMESLTATIRNQRPDLFLEPGTGMIHENMKIM
jgi:2-keto-3-deoxy-6-phosphogluconate aldolase